MKSTILGLALLALTGCATVPSGITVSNEVLRAQQIAIKICGFLPAIETISMLFQNGVLRSAESIASGVCAVISRTSFASAGRTAGAPPKLHGVPVRGQFVR